MAKNNSRFFRTKNNWSEIKDRLLAYYLPQYFQKVLTTNRPILDYTMNHVLGCSHGCKYPCYAFLMAKRFAKVVSYDGWLEPYLVSNTLEILDREIPRLKSTIQSVHLCFTTDPFMYEYTEIEEMSLAAIKKLNKAGIKCTVLTKGLLPAELASSM